MTHQDQELLSKTIVEEAILLTQNNHLPDWQERIRQMDVRVQHLHEQVSQKPVVPTELQDAYREEIDSLTMENMKLRSSLDQTKEALNRAKNAYKAERENNRMLQYKLNELEKRLLAYLGR
jgi:hypothetical protein